MDKTEKERRGKITEQENLKRPFEKNMKDDKGTIWERTIPIMKNTNDNSVKGESKKGQI